MLSLFFDLVSLIYALNSLRVLWRLFKNWRAFWDAEVTPADRALASQVAFFVLIPLGVFLHEAGHALATWQVGGQVVEFQWRVFWGYIVPAGHFTPVQDWWIALSGNLVSILLGLLAIPLLLRARVRIHGELLYAFAKQELYYALMWYPTITFLGLGGDWITIYDFSIAPYAQITLLLHLALLCGLWLLDESAWAARWRIGCSAESLATLQRLEAQAKANPDDAQSQAALAHFYHYMGERSLSLYHEGRAQQLAPDDSLLKVLRALRACDLTHFDAALRLSPDDFDLHYWRGVLKRSMGRDDEARLDFEQAVRLAPDEQSRARAQRELTI